MRRIFFGYRWGSLANNPVRTDSRIGRGLEMVHVAMVKESC